MQKIDLSQTDSALYPKRGFARGLFGVRVATFAIALWTISVLGCGDKETLQQLYRLSQPHIENFVETDLWVRRACAVEAGFVNESTWIESVWLPLRDNPRIAGGFMQSGFRNDRTWLYAGTLGWNAREVQQLKWTPLRFRGDAASSIQVSTVPHQACGPKPCVVFSRDGIDEAGRHTRVVVAYLNAESSAE